MMGLEALEKLRFEPTQDAKALSVVKKYLEAFDIIKKKKVDVVYLMFCFDMDDENASLYNYNEEREPLTEDEFNLLKEVLADENVK